MVSQAVSQDRIDLIVRELAQIARLEREGLSLSNESQSGLEARISNDLNALLDRIIRPPREARVSSLD